MKQKSLISLSLIAIALLGFPSCVSNNISANTTNPATSSQSEPEIKIAGSSSAYPALEVLANAYKVKNSTTKISLLTPTQSEAGIAGVKDGLLEIGVLSRELKPEEAAGKLEYHLLAKDGLLVATHPSVKNIINLTTEQLQGIYSGSIKNWQELGGPNAKIIVLDRPEDESAKRLLRQYYLGQDLKTSPEVVIMRKEGELIEAIQNTPYSIGAFSLAFAISNKLPVNHLSLNGVEPSIENVENGKYQMVRPIGITIKKSPTKPVQEFVDFTRSKTGSQELMKFGFAPSIEEGVAEKWDE